MTIKDLAKKIDKLAKSNDSGIKSINSKLSKRIDDLAESTEKGFKSIDSKLSKQIDDLALSVKVGFDSVDDKFKVMGSKMDKGFDKVNKDIVELKQGQEDIKLRLDQHAYSFDVKALTVRVKALEEHIGISNPTK